MRNREEIVIEDLEILDAGAEGKAIARYNEVVVFIPHAVPGDIVDVRIVKKKRRFMEGTILRLKHPSPMRIDAVCKHFGVCGGCKWQCMDYAAQLEFKRKQIVDNFIRIGKLNVTEIPPVEGADPIYFYRNKLEYAFADRRWLLPSELADESIKQSEGLGFHVPNVFDKVIDISECHLQAEPSNTIRNVIRKYCLEHGLTFYNARQWTGLMRNIVIRSTPDGQVMLIVVFGYQDEAIVPMLEFIAGRFPEITSLNYVINEKKNDTISDLPVNLFKGVPYLEEHMEDLTFRIGPVSFYQTNSKQAYKLYSIARDFAQLTGNEIVYDLYTGTGTIANFVAHQALKVVGVEYVEPAIEDAKLNSTLNNISNTVFYAGDMAKVLNANFVEENGHPDVIITDPPRAGMHPGVVQQLLEIEAGRIVYVSCNPASQARDLALLEEKYHITKIQPVDMFPHTHHIENVVCLELKTGERE
jgi:23S rRNA (uracil1939-C5)-methyltransferase